MSENDIKVKSTLLEPAKIINCMLPDDGTDIKLMRLLKKNKGITRVSSVACRGVNNLQQVKTRSGKLPEATLYRFLSVVVSEEQADDIFGFIYGVANIGQPNRGIMVQTTLLGTTVYSIPEDVADEEI